jgi:hypothetical protein
MPAIEDVAPARPSEEHGQVVLVDESLAEHHGPIVDEDAQLRPEAFDQLAPEPDRVEGAREARRICVDVGDRTARELQVVERRRERQAAPERERDHDDRDERHLHRPPRRRLLPHGDLVPARRERGPPRIERAADAARDDRRGDDREEAHVAHRRERAVQGEQYERELGRRDPRGAERAHDDDAEDEQLRSTGPSMRRSGSPDSELVEELPLDGMPRCWTTCSRGAGLHGLATVASVIIATRTASVTRQCRRSADRAGRSTRALAPATAATARRRS